MAQTVGKGQRISLADLQLLELFANQGKNLAGQNYRFLPPIFITDNKDDLVKCWRADFGEYPGSIVVVRNEAKAYQLFGPYNVLGNWHLDTARVSIDSSALQSTPGILGQIGYVLSNDSVWIYGDFFNAGPTWNPYRPNGEIPVDPDRPSPGGIRGEMYRLWYNLMHPPQPAQHAMVRVNNGGTLSSYTLTPPFSTDVYSFTTSDRLAIRENWGFVWNNPVPIVKWYDRYRNIIFVCDNSFAPVVFTQLDIPARDSFITLDIGPARITSLLFRLRNSENLSGTLTGTIQVWQTFTYINPVTGLTDYTRQPVATDFPELQNYVTSIIPDPNPFPVTRVTTFNLTIPQDIEWLVHYIGPGGIDQDKVPSDPEVLMHFTFTVQTTAADAPVAVNGINLPRGLKGVRPRGTPVYDGNPNIQPVSLGGEISQYRPDSPGWDDTSQLSIFALDGPNNNLDALLVPGVWLAVPAPLARIDAGAQTDLNPFMLSAQGFRVPRQSQPFPDPRDKTGTNLIRVYAAKLYKPPRWPVRRDTEPAFKATDDITFAQVQFGVIKEVYVGRAPDPADPNHLQKRIADRAAVNVSIGCLQAGVFKSFQTVTIPAGSVGTQISPSWPIFTNDPLVYQCSEEVIIQAMICLPNPVIQSMSGLGTYFQNVNQPNFPLCAFSFNDLLEITLQSNPL